MKKLLFSMLLIAAPVTGFSQLKVHSTGKVGVITTSTPSNNANLTVGSTNNIATVRTNTDFAAPNGALVEIENGSICRSNDF